MCTQTCQKLSTVRTHNYTESYTHAPDEKRPAVRDLGKGAQPASLSAKCSLRGMASPQPGQSRPLTEKELATRDAQRELPLVPRAHVPHSLGSLVGFVLGVRQLPM